MIERIENTNKFLYQGRIVDLAFLQARKAELERMIAENQRQIDSIKLIDCSELEGEMKEAAISYNEDKNRWVEAINLAAYTFSEEIKLIEAVWQ